MTITTILFDFFGTLVDYREGASGDGFRNTYALLCELGGVGGYESFLESWSAISAEFEAEANRTYVEYPLEAVVVRYLRSLRLPEAHTGRFVETFIAEWSVGVVFRQPVVAAVRELSRDYRLAVVTNTHLTWLVPSHLNAMGLSDLLPTVVMSIEVGRRKPHPEIFVHALQRTGSRPDETIFVGDSLEADYRGAERSGMRSYLIHPNGAHDVPDERRLATVADLPKALRRLQAS